MAPQLCPHKANPLACPQCYQQNLRKKAAAPPPARVSLDPQITKGKVVNTQTDLVAQQLAARKAQAMTNVDAKIAAKPQLAASAAAPLPAMPARQQQPPAAAQQAPVNPHTVSRRHRAAAVEAPQDVGDNAGVLIDDGEISQLEQMYPKHESIIDRQSSHPEGIVSGPGTIAPGLRSSSRGSRPVITKGRPPL